MLRGFVAIFVMLILLISGNIQSVQGQSLRDRIQGIFAEVLELELAGSPGEHGEHFFPSNVATSSRTINTLSSLIGTNVASFPLSSTVAGLTFDFSSGIPVSTSTSLGPIFAERAPTLGQGRFNFGIFFSYLDFAKLRGTNVNDLRFSFTHQDVGAPGMGDSPNEFDSIDLFPNLDISASILSFNFTYGVTDRLDLGVAVPFVNVRVKSTPFARINSFTYVANDTANHSFGDDPTQPVLTSNPAGLDDDATGVGDIALRAKYNFVRDRKVDFGALIEYRPATGDEENFLGSGHSHVKAMVIFSGTMGNFEPHINIAYNKKGGDIDRDELGIWVGYSQKVLEKLTLALDVAGEFEMGTKTQQLDFPQSVLVEGTPFGKSIFQNISLTNVQNFSRDNLVNASLGLKWNPRESLILSGNVFVPLNDGGLRADYIPTFGFEFNF